MTLPGHVELSVINQENTCYLQVELFFFYRYIIVYDTQRSVERQKLIPGPSCDTGTQIVEI